MLIKNTVHRLDDADYKTSLKIYNFPYGSKLNSLIDIINKELKQNGIETFSLDEDKKTKILTSNFIIISFRDFNASFKALVLINSLNFRNRKLKANHLFGNLKKTQGHYREMLIQNRNIVLEQKLEELRQREKIKSQERYFMYSKNSEDNQDFEETDSFFDELVEDVETESFKNDQKF